MAARNEDTKRTSLLSSNAILQERVQSLVNQIDAISTRFIGEGNTTAETSEKKVSSGSINDMIDANVGLIGQVAEAMAQLDHLVEALGER